MEAVALSRTSVSRAGQSPSALSGISPRVRRLLTVFLMGMAFLNLYAVWKARDAIRNGSNDFVHLYVAGYLIRHGQGAQLFDDSTQFETQKQFSRYVRTMGAPYPYMHPPWEALLFVPLTAFSLSTAYLFWTSINLAALLVFLSLVRRHLPPLQIFHFSWLALCCIAFFPISSVIFQGQDDLLVLLLFTLVFFSLARHNFFAAGAWLGLALFRAQFTIPLFCVLAFASGWTFFAGFASVAALLTAITLAVFGWPMLRDYPRHLFSAERSVNVGGFLVGHMPNLHGLFSEILAGKVPEFWLTGLVLVVSAALVVWTSLFYKREHRISLSITFSAGIVTALLVSYHSFAHDLSLLLLSLALQLGWLGVHRMSRLATWLLIFPVFILFLIPLCYVMLRYRLFCLYAVALLLWFVGIVLAGQDAKRMAALTS